MDPGGTFHVGFSNVQAGTFTLLGSTNVSQPLSNWTALGTVPEVAPGQYQLNEPGARINSYYFYRLRSR